jgi:hypothetical protein
MAGGRPGKQFAPVLGHDSICSPRGLRQNSPLVVFAWENRRRRHAIRVRDTDWTRDLNLKHSLMPFDFSFGEFLFIASQNPQCTAPGEEIHACKICVGPREFAFQIFGSRAFCSRSPPWRKYKAGDVSGSRIAKKTTCLAESLVVGFHLFGGDEILGSHPAHQYGFWSKRRNLMHDSS